jgi:hypothetical protein
MIPAATTMTVLTHPLQVLLAGVILLHGLRAAIAAVVESRRPGAGIHPAPVAGPSHLGAAQCGTRSAAFGCPVGVSS